MVIQARTARALGEPQEIGAAEWTMEGKIVMESSAAVILRELKLLRDPERAHHLQRFFKTGPGEYGEGDRFMGLRVPQVRALARRNRGVPLTTMIRLLHSPWHEARLLALILMAQGVFALTTLVFVVVERFESREP